MTAFFKMIALTAFCILSVPAAAEVIRFDVENHSQRRAWVDLPDNAKGAVPVVVLLHSFTGLDQRETVIGRAIRNAGYAAAAPDLRSGIYSSEADRPSGRDFAAMTIRLIAVLRSDARFDSSKVALVGFSQGADIGLNLAGGSPNFTANTILAAVVAYYPGCVGKRTETTVPVQIHLGGKDVPTATAAECQTLVDAYNQVNAGFGELHVYDGVYHAFNNPDATSLGGNRVMRGQKLLTLYDRAATELAEKRTLGFLAKQFDRPR